MQTPSPGFPGWRQSPALSAAVLLAFVLCFAGIGSHHLWSPDEPTGAAVGRAMLESGDFIVPRLNGRPFLEKPPLYWWAEAAALRLFGMSPAAARFASALFSALTLLVAYALGRRLGGPRTGLLAVAVLGSTVLFVEQAQRVVVDPALAFFVALSHLGFAILAEPRSPAERRLSLGLIAVAVPLAFLSKGVVALGLAVAPPVLWLVATRRRQALRDLLPLALLGAPVFALLVVPWALALVRAAGWPALRECLVSNSASRLFHDRQSSIYGHSQPAWYYLTTAPVVMLPWSIALPAMWRSGLLRRRPGSAGSESQALLFATVVIGFVLLSAAASKRELYLLPLLPAYSACAARWLEGTGERSGAPDAWDRRTRAVLLALAAVLPLLLWVAAVVVRWVPPSRAALAPLQTELAPAVLAVYGFVVLAASGLLIGRLAKLQRQEPGAPLSAAWIVIPFLVLFLALETDVKARVDPVKSMSDLTAAIPLELPAPAPVPAYLPSRTSPESLFGIIGFDLGRQTLPLTTPEELRAYVDREPGGCVVLRANEAPTVPLDLRRRLLVVYDETGRKANPFMIAAWRPLDSAALDRAAGGVIPSGPPRAWRVRRR